MAKKKSLRTEKITIRFTKPERKSLELRAKKHKVTVSDVVRANSL